MRGLSTIALAFVCAAPLSAQVIKPGQGQSTMVDSTTILKQSTKIFTPWQFGAILGDCTTDNGSALTQAANAAVAAGNGQLWTGDSCLAFGTTFNPPAGLVWRGDFSQAHKLIWLGSQSKDAILVTSALDIDGIRLDGNRPSADVRTDITTTKTAFGIAFHGSMVVDAPTYLTGLKIGRLAYQHGEAVVGMGFVNVSGMTAQDLEVSDNWGAAYQYAGVKDTTVQYRYCYDVGTFGPQTGRAGQCGQIFAESDPNKQPDTWYVIPYQNSPTLANSQPYRVILPTDNLYFGTVYNRNSADTMEYIHDYGIGDTAANGGRPTDTSANGPTGWGTGVSNVRYGTFDGALAGKDCFKVRNYAYGVTVKGVCKQSAARGATVEAFSHDVDYDMVVDTTAYDTVSVMLGATYGTHFYQNNQTVGAANYNGTNESMNVASHGFDCNGGAYRVTFRGVARNISGLPYSPTSDGYGVYVYSCQDVTADVTTDTGGNSAARISNALRLNLTLNAKDPCRQQSAGGCYGILVTPDQGDSKDLSIRWNMRESTAVQQMAAPVRISGSPSNISLNGSATPSQYVRSGFSGDMVVVSGTATNVQSAPLWQTSRTLSGQTTDANGQLTYAISAHATPVIDSAYVLGGGYQIVPYSLSSTSVVFQVTTASGAAAVSTSVGTVGWSAHVQNSDGF